MTIQQICQLYSTKLLPIYGERETQALTYLALAHILQKTKLQILMDKQQLLTPLQVQQLEQMLEELEGQKPIQYLTKVAHFYGMELKVTPAVLIPRPETEELVEWIITSSSSSKNKPYKILDIGTGSGCIPLALKKENGANQIFAIDVSPKALQIAQENAEQQQLAITFKQVDILDRKQWQFIEQVDIIVSNPPYITVAEQKKMADNVVAHEPHLALFVPNDNPLLFYEVIADFALEKLNKNGQLFFEVHEDFALDTQQLLQQKGFVNCQLRKDINGKYRMLNGELSS